MPAVHAEKPCMPDSCAEHVEPSGGPGGGGEAEAIRLAVSRATRVARPELRALEEGEALPELAAALEGLLRGEGGFERAGGVYAVEGRPGTVALKMASPTLGEWTVVLRACTERASSRRGAW